MIRSATWSLPLKYADGTDITPAAAARIVTHLFMDDVEIGVSSPGAVSWEGDVTMVVGQPYTFKATCELDGKTSLPSVEVVFTVPFVQTNPPLSLIIT